MEPGLSREADDWLAANAPPFVLERLERIVETTRGAVRISGAALAWRERFRRCVEVLDTWEVEATDQVLQEEDDALKNLLIVIDEVCAEAAPVDPRRGR